LKKTQVLYIKEVKFTVRPKIINKSKEKIIEEIKRDFKHA